MSTVDDLMERAGDMDSATHVIVRAALSAADDVTHECGTPESSAQAVALGLADTIAALQRIVASATEVG